MTAQPKIGITLSGGGARGIAHIGVLKALEEHLIFPEVISGASAGSIVGALYASGMHPDKILEFAEKSSLYRAFNLSYSFSGLADLQYLKDQLAKYIEHDSFESLKKPLFVSVCNLNKGCPEIISEGPLFDVVKASSSIPLIFRPTMIGGQTYVDGGLMNNFPSHCIRDKCDLLIGVNVMPHVTLAPGPIKSIIDIAVRSFELSIWNNTRECIECCDYFIEPKAVRDYHIFNFGQTKKLFDIGYEAGLNMVPTILKRIL